jgi:hypothetical protein
VRLRQHQTRNDDTKYVRAASEAGAIRTAKANSMLPLNAAVIEVRRATPADLGCVEVQR